jgi:FAD/FMN-containing dehydrogenase
VGALQEGGTATVTSEQALGSLAATVHGSVLKPGEQAYEAARRIFNGMIDKRPRVIVQALGAGDVMQAVRFARHNDLLIAVRGGGHNVAGHALCDDGMLVDLSRLRSVRVDPKRQVAHADPGCSYTDFDLECQAHGLATTGGTVASTGIAGLTLGGGLGFLMGSYGLACDNVRSVDIVLADGRFTKASADENPDLYWAVRGGGGNFGVVTSFEFQLHPVRQLLGGMVIWPIKDGREALQAFRDVTMTGPDELSCAYAVVILPEMGKVALVAACYNGPVEQGAPLVRPFQRVGKPLVDGIRPISYVEVQHLFAEIPFGLQNYWKGHLVRKMPEAAIDAVMDAADGMTSEHSAILIEAPHGAASRVPDADTAYSQRDKRYNISALAIWEEDGNPQRHIQWARDLASRIAPLSGGGAAYVNYLNDDASADEVKGAYGGEKYQRLRMLKATYDPENVFRYNQNIPPA